MKKQASNTALELYRWLGDAVMPLLEDVRDAQKKDLKALFAKHARAPDASPPTPTMTLRCLQGLDAAAAAYAPLLFCAAM